MKTLEAFLSPAELRSEAARFLHLSKIETAPQLRRAYAGCAFAVSQLAECIEVQRAKPGL